MPLRRTPLPGPWPPIELPRLTMCKPNIEVVLKITDTCPCKGNEQWCCGDQPHLDLSNFAFAAVRGPGGRAVELPALRRQRGHRAVVGSGLGASGEAGGRSNPTNPPTHPTTHQPCHPSHDGSLWRAATWARASSASISGEKAGEEFGSGSSYLHQGKASGEVQGPEGLLVLSKQLLWLCCGPLGAKQWAAAGGPQAVKHPRRHTGAALSCETVCEDMEH